MALRMSQTARPAVRGVLAHPRPSGPLAAYVVLATPANGMKIAGQRRARGEIFHAHPRHMAFLLREGVVAVRPEMTAAPAPGATP